MSTLLEQISRANIYLQPIQFILGIGLNAITICVLSSRTLRASSCTYYLLAYSIFAIMYIVQICPGTFLASFNMFTSCNDASCKISGLTINLAPTLARQMLVLASWDRFCSSSSSIRLRSQSTTKKAKRNIIIVTVVTTISMLPALIVYYWNETIHTCLTYTDLASLIFIFAQTIYINIFTILFIVLFGYVTIYNIQQSKRRVRAEKNHERNHRTEGQLARMLILQIFVIVITSIPYIIVYSMIAISPSAQTLFMLAIRNIMILIVETQH